MKTPCSLFSIDAYASRLRVAGSSPAAPTNVRMVYGCQRFLQAANEQCFYRFSSRRQYRFFVTTPSALAFHRTQTQFSSSDAPTLFQETTLYECEQQLRLLGLGLGRIASAVSSLSFMQGFCSCVKVLTLVRAS